MQESIFLDLISLHADNDRCACEQKQKPIQWHDKHIIKVVILLLSYCNFDKKEVKQRDSFIHSFTMGVTKEVLKAGNGSKPSAGQQVTVHCTGYGKNQDLSKKFWCKSFLFLRLRFGWCTVAGLGSTVVSPLSVLYYYTVPSSETMNAFRRKATPTAVVAILFIAHWICLFVFWWVPF